jgi:RNA polymerase sigma-70 factor (ECF subfamily)
LYAKKLLIRLNFRPMRRNLASRAGGWNRPGEGETLSESADRLYEQVLLLRCQAGDEAAFVEIVFGYDPRLRYFLRKLVHQTHLVDDLLQEVWLDVHRGLPKLRELAAFRSWLYRIARDRAMRHLRKREPVAALPEDFELLEEVDETAFTFEDVAHIHAALDQLPPAQREVLVLRYLEAMSYNEIGQVIAVPPGTVRSRLHYAKQTLRHELERTMAHD